MFLIRYPTNRAESAFETFELVPGPTEVDYPDRRDAKVHGTQDQGVVVQRPVSDSRPRRWVWKGYPASLRTYEELWSELKPLDTRSRLEAGLPAHVYIWEGVTDEGGFGETIDGRAPDLVGKTNLKWTRVRLLQVTRKCRKGGGSVRYEDSVVEFVIDDPNYGAF